MSTIEKVRELTSEIEGLRGSLRESMDLTQSYYDECIKANRELAASESARASLAAANQRLRDGLVRLTRASGMVTDRVFGPDGTFTAVPPSLMQLLKRQLAEVESISALLAELPGGDVGDGD